MAEKKKFSFEKLGKTFDKATANVGKAAKEVASTAKKIGNAVDQFAKSDDTKAAVEKTKESIKSGAANTVEFTKKTASKVAEKTKQAIDKTKETITPDQMNVLLNTCYEKALNGIPGVSPEVRKLADDYLKKHKDVQSATKVLINNQVTKCATSGFISNLGGLITLPVAIPANLGSVLYVQMRMISAIAVMGGYDPSDDQVQTMAYLCLTGNAINEVVKSTGIKLGQKLAVGGIQKIAGATLTKINQAVGFRLITKFGTKGILNLGQMVPIVGGLIGGTYDYFSTKSVAKNAYKMFIGDELKDSDIKEGTVVEDAEFTVVSELSDEHTEEIPLAEQPNLVSKETQE